MAVEIDEPVIISQVNYYEVVGRSETYSEETNSTTITLFVLEGFVEENGSITHVRTIPYAIPTLRLQQERARVCVAQAYADEIVARNYDLAQAIGAIPTP